MSCSTGASYASSVYVRSIIYLFSEGGEVNKAISTSVSKCNPHNFPTNITSLSSGHSGIGSLLKPIPVSPTLASSLVFLCSALDFQNLLLFLGSC